MEVMAQEFLVFCFMLMNEGDKRRGKQTKPNRITVCKCEFNAASWRKCPARGWYIHPARGWYIHIQQSSAITGITLYRRQICIGSREGYSKLF